MFKKPLDDLKTSAPLKNSDRRNLRHRILQYFDLIDESPEVGDLLVPDGLQSVKFTTHNGEPGVAYLSPDGEPLWFTLGKGNNDLIPTIYTLWKRPRLLPFLATPPVVISVLTGGADLMIAGVVESTDDLKESQLVAVTCYSPNAIGPPLAVGRMAVTGEQLRVDGAKGKAVYILHTVKDKLWEMGRKSEPLEPTPCERINESERTRKDLKECGEVSPVPAREVTPPPPPDSGEDIPPLGPDEVSSILRTTLLQAIRTSVSSLPPGTFPMPSTKFYTAHILSARPAHMPSSTPVDIKHSAHKNLTAFLKAAEKEGLLRLKEAKGKSGGDVQVLSVSAVHSEVQAHSVYKTLGEAEAKRERREECEAAETSRSREIVVTELWKPHQQSIRLFEERGKDFTALFKLSEIKETLNAYICAKSLVNLHQQQFINVDDLLRDVLATKGSDVPEFMKRDELTHRLVKKMQPWHGVEADRKEPVLRKGKLEPISVVVKLRQGRKACTLLTGFETYFLVADALADELRRVCASSASVAPLPGNGAGLEVMVQGKQIKAISQVLLAKGVPKKWIETADLTEKKKK